MTTTSIPALLEPIQARLDAATPGPWHLDRDEPGDVASVVAYAHNDGVTIGTYVADTVEEDGDAAFIAASPTDTARLLAAVKAVDSILSQAITMISADPDVSEYERGFDDSTCGLSAKLRSAVESALRCEA